MTVSYQYEVASSTSGGFTRLLFMWRGSLYKLIYRELLLFIAAFCLLSALYRRAFNQDQKRIFEKMVVYCDTFINLIPLSFVLGFYVAYVAGRWWQQYMAIPWPDKIMHSIALYVCGNDDHGRMIRRTLMRYLNLTLILVLRSISSAVKRRFPTLDHLVESGFMTVIELEMYQSVPSVEFNTYWIPCTWFISLLKETKKGSRITDTQGLKIIMEEFNEFRSKCGLLWSYDWVSIPLVYTQVVTIATYSFFLAALVGRQYVDTAKKPLQMEIDIYIPVFTILQFFFFMGLLKVAEQLINPFGDDDEDFELNWLIDRHTKVSYLGVDILMTRSPPLVKDMYFDQVDLTLPYTEAAVAYKKKTYRGSVHNMQVPEEKHTMFLPEISEEEDEDKTPTPKSSLQNLTSATSSQPSGPATASAAAAGIWRSQQSSPQSLHKTSEMDPELETEFVSCQHLEVAMGMDNTIPGDQRRKEGETTSVTNCFGNYGPSKSSRPLYRSESAPVKNPVFGRSCEQAWPSSSTLGQSDISFQCSEPSVDASSCQNYSSISGCGSGVDNFFVCTDSVLNNLQHLSIKSQVSERSLDSYGIQNYNEHSSRAKSEGIGSNFPSERQSENNHSSKVKSCPRLIPIKKHSSACNGRKKGVRWKPMVSEASGKSDNSQRRQTVDVIPVVQQISDTSTSNTRFNDSSGEEIPLQSTVNQIYCKWCNRKLEIPMGAQHGALEGLTTFGKNVAKSAPNLSLEENSTHKMLSNSGFNLRLHQMMNTRKRESNEVKLSSKNLIQERRATVSVLNLSGTEFDTKRWQSRPFWEHKFGSGFLRRIKNIHKQAGLQHFIHNVLAKSETSKLGNRKSASQSLPNIFFPVSHQASLSLPHNSQATCSNLRQAMPTVLISGPVSTNNSGSEDSSVFSSLLEIPIEGSSTFPSSVTKAIVEGKNSHEKVMSNLSVNNRQKIAGQFSSNTNLSISNNSSEMLNASSQDTTWQSADWSTRVLGADSGQDTLSNIKESNTGQLNNSNGLSTFSASDDMDLGATSGLQEVVIDYTESPRSCARWTNQNGS